MGALLMIVRDIASFVVVLVIALLGFGEALYFILAPRADELDDGEPNPFETPQGALMAMTAMLLGDFETEHFADPASVAFFVIFNIMGGASVDGSRRVPFCCLLVACDCVRSRRRVTTRTPSLSLSLSLRQ